MGIGIHFGTTMIGCLGVEERLDATVVGDTVNLSARLESITKQLKVQTLVSRSCLAADLDPSTAPLCRYLGEVNVAGKKVGTDVFELLEDPNKLHAEGETELAAQVESKLATRDRLGEALQLSKAGEIAKSIAILDALIVENPYDLPLTVLRGKVEAGMAFEKMPKV